MPGRATAPGRRDSNKETVATSISKWQEAGHISCELRMWVTARGTVAARALASARAKRGSLESLLSIARGAKGRAP